MTTFADPPSGGQDQSRNVDVNLDANVSGYVAGVGQAEQRTNALASAVGGLSVRVDSLSKRASRGLEHFAVGDLAALGGATADAAGLEKSLGTLNATSAVTGVSMRGLKADVTSAFDKFPIHRSQVVGLVQDISGLGVTAPRDIGKLTQTVIKLGAATGESMPQLAGGLIQLSRLMGNLDPTKITNMANAVLTTSKNAGVSASGVLEFGQAIAPMARQAGIGEAAVVGISTAFSKAGADGYVAANTFNSIVNDITTLTRTGSPELAKYATFVGTTVEKFKQLPPAEQITRIFETIAKGGPQALTFVQELGLGTRALSAVQAVAQSGGLRQQINLALDSSTNQRNLDKGSKAAFNNLSDVGNSVRNDLTQMGDTIGGYVLPPLTLLGRGLHSFLSVVNDVLRAMGPVPAILGTLAGGLSAVAGIAIGHAALIGTAAGARLLLSPNSGPRRALREGREVGAATRAGMAPEEAAGLNRSAVMYAGGSMPLRAKVPYLIGRQQGEAGGVGMRPLVAGIPGMGFVGSAFRSGMHPEEAAAAAAQAERTSASAGRMAAAWTAKGIFGGPAWFLNQQSKTLNDSRVPDYQRSAYQGLGQGTSMTAQAAAINAGIKLRLAESGVIKITAQEAANLARAMVGTAAATTRAGASMAAAGMGAAGRGLGRAAVPGPLRGAVGGMASFAGRGIGVARRGLGAVGGALMSPAGFLGLTLGLPLAMGLASKIGSTDSKAYNVDGSFNAISKYDNLLGQTSTNLASFSKAVNDASSKLGGLSTTGKSLAEIAQVTQPDIAQSSGGYKVTDSSFTKLAKSSPKNTAAAVSYIQALALQHGGMDAKTLQAVKQDLIATYGPSQAQAILSAYTSTGPQNALSASVDYGALGTAAHDYKGLGTGGFKDLIGQGISGVQSQAALAPGKQSNRAELSAVLSMFGSALTGTTYTTAGDQVKASRAYLAKVFGGKQSDYALPDRSTSNLQDPQYKQLYGSPESIQRIILGSIAGTKSGRQYLASAGVDIGKGTPAELERVLASLGGAGFPGLKASESNNQLMRYGALGRFAATNPTVQAAVGDQVGNPRVAQNAVAGLAATAERTSGNLADASGALMKLSDAMGGADTATGALLAQAAQWVRTLQGFRLLGTSRNTQLGASLANVQASRSAAAGPHATQATVDQYKSDLQAYEQQKEGYRQYLVSVYQQAQQYGVQMRRAAEDENTQIFRSKRNFYIQMQQAQQDFQRQTMRSQEDFATQEKRQAQQAAQSIYAPFDRVQAQFTIDAGTLVQNLQDQNRRIAEQYSQLAKLKRMGLSQASIDTLDLSNPQNSQQLNNLVQTIATDPSLIGQINKAVSTRVSATTKLTQSEFNMTFRNTVADFNLALNRTSQDYQTAHDRAVAAQRMALSDMSVDYSRMIDRSAEDLKTAMTEITGSFGKLFGGTMSMVNREVAKYAPGAAAVIDRQLAALKAKYPGLFNDADLSTLPTPASAVAGAVIRTSGPNVRKHNALGGIAMRATVFDHGRQDYGEAGPEALIPLNQRGESFMAGLIAKSLAQGIHMAISSAPAMPAPANEDHSTTYSGPITVQATDPAEMERKLAARKKLAQLTNAGRRRG